MTIRFIVWLSLSVLSLTFAPAVRADTSVMVERVWSKATPPNATAAVVYLVLSNRSEVSDRLLRVVSPVSDRAEMHVMRMLDGVAMMQPLDDGVELQPGSEVEFAPGGLHLMLVGLTGSLVEGQSFSIELIFEKANPVIAEVHVLAINATEPPP